MGFLRALKEFQCSRSIICLQQNGSYSTVTSHSTEPNVTKSKMKISVVSFIIKSCPDLVYSITHLIFVFGVGSMCSQCFSQFPKSRGSEKNTINIAAITSQDHNDSPEEEKPDGAHENADALPCKGNSTRMDQIHSHATEMPISNV